MRKLPKDVIDNLIPKDYIAPEIKSERYELEWTLEYGIPEKDTKRLKHFIENSLEILPHVIDAIEVLKQKSMKITGLNKHDSDYLYSVFMELYHEEYRISLTWDGEIFIFREEDVMNSSASIRYQLGILHVNLDHFK